MVRVPETTASNIPSGGICIALIIKRLTARQRVSGITPGGIKGEKREQYQAVHSPT